MAEEGGGLFLVRLKSMLRAVEHMFTWLLCVCLSYVFNAISCFLQIQLEHFRPADVNVQLYFFFSETDISLLLFLKKCYLI